jgi:hypothetical protein
MIAAEGVRAVLDELVDVYPRARLFEVARSMRASASHF